MFSIIIILFLVFAFASDTSAIPAFARHYKISCTTCHDPFPKLKAYGDEFAGDGFVMPEEESDRDYIIAGDDLLRLNRDFPIAVRADLLAAHDSDKEVKSDLRTPWGLKLLSGGLLYKNIGYYFYFYISERGEVAGVEDAYIHFNNLFGREFDIMVGQFQTSDPLMKRELRLTVEDYEIYKSRIGASGTNLAYDRGVMLVYGIPQTGTDLVAMVVNGNGIPEAGENRVYDNDKYKNFGLRVTQGLGDIASVGGFYYYGKESISHQLVDPIETYTGTNEVTYMGPDVNVGLGILEFTGQYLIRKDTEPMSGMEDIETTGIVAEVIYAPQKDKSRFYLTGLYNNIDSDMDAFDYETATLSGTYLVARNLRLIGEYTRNLKKESNLLTVGVISAF